jgi:hypothetical protein
MLAQYERAEGGFKLAANEEWIVFACGWGSLIVSAEVRLREGADEETSLSIPTADLNGKKDPTIHVILTERDSGSPALFAYRRAVITVEP